MSAERDRVTGFGRLEDGLRQPGAEWYRWGPYVSERQWGTVREDYSADGNAWDYLPHDHARSQVYRWGEDGLAGFCDIEQRLCLGLALWNGRDPILKERAFGLTGPQGNHGEDVKEYWWYLDAMPSHAWNRWRYHYPPGRVPLSGPDRCQRPPEPVRARVRTAGHRRVRRRPVLDHRGALRESRPGRPADGHPCHQRRAGGRSTLHVLPTAWFRNTWSWELSRPSPGRRCGPPGTGRSRSTIRSRAPWNLPPRPARTVPARSCCSARTRPTWPGCTAPSRSRPIPRTASTTT